MIIQTLIVNSIATNRTESALLADVETVIERLALGGAAYANDLICQHFHRQISSGFALCAAVEENESLTVFRTLEEQQKMLEIFKYFVIGVATLLGRFDELSLEFDQNAKAKGELIEQTIAFLRASSHPILDSKLNIFDVILTTVIARKTENDKILLTGQLKKLNDASSSDNVSLQIRIHLIRVLLTLQVSL